MDQHNNFTDHPKASTAAQISKEAGHNTDHRKKSSSHLNRHLTTITVNDKDYMVIKAIGRGGTSKVYSAITPSGKICAIKVVDLTGADELIRTSYFKEITLLENLRGCETIVQLYDWEVQDLRDELIVVMEHGSTDLAVFLKKEDPRKMADWHRISFWKQMLLAVDLIHKKGIIHCDLKPANFIIVEGKLKLIDFNIADAIQEDETSIKREMTVGSFNYMAPEAIVDTRQKGFRYKGKPSAKIGRKADVWSLGCILYYMVYGRTPFQSIMDNVEKLCKIIDPHYNIDFPDVANTVWVDVIKKCLQRDPNERASIEELLNLDLYKGDQRA
ncbi:uncharacterized protein TRIADDRAFT_25361 [Trichoplax adhaerens]|uniref:Protein kinase domain-containing protein n=1 Tax=Trichoplax adhaerens TaxID=10228 RepID=B3RYC0_TRIAD|nr:hypothetical protein TRIADDRAFT_25361 [Trichoplax adhaerens]EDV25011.1 hypothetical protein TRIADDRAFT_25361 [Trichoplax adhaerens]|eukprot:XP_002112901.1 hypothetical protein TRIADDRAFT_25361 [Trichoplax adhaerens]